MPNTQQHDDDRKRFFLADEDDGLMGDDEDVQPLIEFGRKRTLRKPPASEKKPEPKCRRRNKKR